MNNENNVLCLEASLIFASYKHYLSYVNAYRRKTREYTLRHDL